MKSYIKKWIHATYLYGYYILIQDSHQYIWFEEQKLVLEYKTKIVHDIYLTVSILSKKRQKDPVKDILIEAMKFVEDIFYIKEGEWHQIEI